MSAILIQENKERIHDLIFLMSIPLKNQELRYSQMEKHVYAMVRALEYFGFYVLHSHSVIYLLEA